MIEISKFILFFLQLHVDNKYVFYFYFLSNGKKLWSDEFFLLVHLI
jgi:hypothetical protein